MKKTIKIQGVIEPEMLKNIAEQIEEQDIQSDDDVDVLFDSEGGVIDVAFCIANLFKKMQNDKVNLRALSEGKVYSSALVPFLAINDREALKKASFLIHKATYPSISYADKDQLKKYAAELDKYTDILDEYYQEHGISLTVRKHLSEGGDLKLNAQEAVECNIVNTIVNEPARIYNRFKSITDKVFTPHPKFSYIQNSKQLDIMTRKEVDELIATAINAAVPKIIDGVAQVVNEMALPPMEELPSEPMNASTEVTAEELGKLTGVLYKTPVTIKDDEKVKFLVHPAKDVEKDHFVIPTDEAGEVMKLAAGDYDVTVDGAEFTIHSTGVDFYIHGKSVTNEVPEVEKEEDEEDEEEVKVEVEKKPENKPCNYAPSKAPSYQAGKVPVVKNSTAREAYEIFKEYGPGYVGA